MSAYQRIPLLPLRTVLFPQGLLPLRIFETRYLDMIRRVMREDSGFGVALILDGAEIGKIGEVAMWHLREGSRFESARWPDEDVGAAAALRIKGRDMQSMACTWRCSG